MAAGERERQMLFGKLHANGHGGFAGYVKGFGTIIMPWRYCREHSIVTEADAAKEMSKSLLSKGVLVMWEFKC